MLLAQLSQCEQLKTNLPMCSLWFTDTFLVLDHIFLLRSPNLQKPHFTHHTVNLSHSLIRVESKQHADYPLHCSSAAQDPDWSGEDRQREGGVEARIRDCNAECCDSRIPLSIYRTKIFSCLIPRVCRESHRCSAHSPPTVNLPRSASKMQTDLLTRRSLHQRSLQALYRLCVSA